MDKLQLKFIEFASEVFQHAAPLTENPDLEDAVRELVMASNRMGAGFYRKNFWDFSDEEFEQNISSARMDMYDTLLWLKILVEAKPNNKELQLLEMKANGLMAFLGGFKDERMAV